MPELPAPDVASLPKPSPHLLKEGNGYLQELQTILAGLGKDERRKSQEFQTILATYKDLGAELHEARKRLPAPPVTPARQALPARGAPTALQRARVTPSATAPAGGQPLAGRSGPGALGLAAMGAARQSYDGRTAAGPEPNQMLGQQPGAASQPATTVDVPAAVPVPAPQPIPEDEPVPLPSLDSPLALPKFTGTLGPPGSRCVDLGPAVKNLQLLLIAFGYDVIATETYDVRTFRAVQKFQMERNLPVNGIVGLETRRLLNESVSG